MFGKIHAALIKRREQWESLCSQCGLCCHEKEIGRGGKVTIDLRAPCRYLDVNTKTCTVYEKRFRVCKECRKVTLYHALFSRYMPESCGYVRHYRKWRLFPPPQMRE